MSGFLDERANLAGKVAAVVGGGGGIGAGISLALAGAGVELAICDIDAGALAETEAAIASTGGKVAAMTADATEEGALDAFYDMVERTCPRLDIVVNVAGGTKRQLLAEASRADIARDIHRNYGYVVQSVQRAVPLIRRSGDGGSIINFTTIEAHRGAASFSVYAGAKAATTNFTRSMAVELGKDKIRVSCIAPDTTMSRGNMDAMPPSFAEGFARLPPHVQGKGLEIYIPRGEQPPVDALADAVLFLGSDLSTFVSGMTLHVDGGTMAAAGMLDWPFGDGFVPTPLAGTLARLYRDGDGA
ncbi:short-chain dehydrogenase/reductase SDR [Sphingobium chlorophenolicum L-1]|uniref:Short-chain dehydrogenase/reductase SDR n=1 Tax=Sphingobium chlorophenolicum L-1 TaxID=690566 RepID=F6F137_SPHCR|nr:SDR family oxidoreductase [Sphingobium chlorophenolicum]AEG51253.1 short-chain dehydrogenase/reductase SDR [Sphingobium chlorophenolicum L-1]